jgi:hypothetical protein
MTNSSDSRPNKNDQRRPRNNRGRHGGGGGGSRHGGHNKPRPGVGESPDANSQTISIEEQNQEHRRQSQHNDDHADAPAMNSQQNASSENGAPTHSGEAPPNVDVDAKVDAPEERKRLTTPLFPKLRIDELKRMNIAELVSIAEKYYVDGASGLR